MKENRKNKLGLGDIGIGAFGDLDESDSES